MGSWKWLPLFFSVFFSVLSSAAEVTPAVARLREILNYAKANAVCNATLDASGTALSAKALNTRGSTLRVVPITLKNAATFRPILHQLSDGDFADLIGLGNQKYTAFQNGAVVNLAIYDGNTLIATAQLANTNFEKLPNGTEVPNTQRWAEISYQIHPGYAGLPNRRPRVESEIVRALSQIAFEKLKVEGVHSRVVVDRDTLLDSWVKAGMGDTVSALDASKLEKQLIFTFAMSRVEYVATNEALEESPTVIDVPAVGFPDMVTDAVTLAKMNEIKDKKTREAAREAYYPDPVPRWKKIMAAGALGIAGWFGFEVVSQFVQDPTIFKALATVPAFLMGVFAADYANSEFHWGLDNTFYNTNNRFLQNLARDARIHHEDPQACLRNTYLGRLSEIGPVAIAGFLSLGAMLKYAVVGSAVDSALSLVGVPKGSLGTNVDFTAATFLGSFILAGWHGTITHQMAHDPKPPWIWRQLQRLTLSISRKRHMDHHTPPYDHIYSTQTGWVDWLHPRAYWQRRMRRFYERTGRMPGTWIQDPRAIPEDIRAELVRRYEENASVIPMELWAYAPKAYPKRVPPDLVEPLKFVQEKWRADFIVRRQRDFQDIGKRDLRAAQRAWEEEQLKYPWIYGPTPQPLDMDA